LGSEETAAPLVVLAGILALLLNINALTQQIEKERISVLAKHAQKEIVRLRWDARGKSN